MLAAPESRSIRSVVALVAALALLAVLPAVASASWWHPGPPPPGVDLTNADRCDFLDTAQCLLPWPNDYFTIADRHSETGRRLNISIDSVPRNKNDVPIDPTEQNRSDGFSPGNMIITKVPGLDTPEAFKRTGAVPVTDIARTYDRRQPIVVINTRTKKRHLIWSELDANPTNPADVNLLIRPGRELRRGHALHRRAAQPQGLRRQHAPSVGRLQALPRRPAHQQPGDRAPPPAHGVALPDALAGRHRAP